jgi:hypothetical protein
VTAPDEPVVPWLRPTAELPAVAVPPNRRLRVALLLPVVGLLVLCCAGGALVNGVFRGAHPAAGPSLVVPPPPTPGAIKTSPTAPPPSAPATTRPSAHPRPTTRRPTTPAPRPTTAPPSAPATSPAVQQGVRAGQLCSPAGAVGVTKHGKVLHCLPSPNDPRDRWRVALQPQA